MQMTCRWWKGWGRLKEPDSSNRCAGWRSRCPHGPMAGRVESPPCLRVPARPRGSLVATPRRRSPPAAPLQPRRAGRGGLGCQRPSRRWRRARGSARAREVSGSHQSPWPAPPRERTHRAPQPRWPRRAKVQRDLEGWRAGIPGGGCRVGAPAPPPGDIRGPRRETWTPVLMPRLLA